MIRIDNVEVFGLHRAIEGARLSFNSNDKSDTQYILNDWEYGKCDLELLKKLAKAGPSEAKYRRSIIVYADITAPLYWWKQFDTYKVGTVSLSSSTMHTLCKKDLTRDDFSLENITAFEEEGVQKWMASNIDRTIGVMNAMIEAYKNNKENGNHKKAFSYERALFEMLPESFNQKRMITMNYETLASIYKQRYGHKLTEWTVFRLWIESLPYAQGIIYPEENN